MRFIRIFFLCVFAYTVQGFSIEFTPLYPDFLDATQQKQDVLPMTCTNVADVSFLHDGLPISEIHLVLGYDTDMLRVDHILRSKDDTYRTWQRVESDRIVYTRTSTRTQTLSGDSVLFSFVFHSLSDVHTGSFFVDSSSYVLMKNGDKKYFDAQTFVLSFASVASCSPDTIVPGVALVSPAHEGTGVSIDEPVRLRFTDTVSGIDWEKISVLIDGLRYVVGDDAVSVQEDTMEIHPLLDFAYGTSVLVSVTAPDLSKPTANVAHVDFSFQTSNDFAVCKNAGCFDFAVQTITTGNCVQLQKLYMQADPVQQRMLEHLGQNFTRGCSFAGVDQLSGFVQKQACTQENIQTAKKVSINVFSMLGRILFGVTFLLKIRYIVLYRKRKKYAKKMGF